MTRKPIQNQLWDQKHPLAVQLVCDMRSQHFVPISRSDFTALCIFIFITLHPSWFYPICPSITSLVTEFHCFGLDCHNSHFLLKKLHRKIYPHPRVVCTLYINSNLLIDKIFFYLKVKLFNPASLLKSTSFQAHIHLCLSEFVIQPLPHCFMLWNTLILYCILIWKAPQACVYRSWPGLLKTVTW